MNITLLTAFDKNLTYGPIGEKNKEIYCAKHGYRFVCEKEGFVPYRAPSWSKILFCQKHLRECDWLFWTDADALITNMDVRLESFIDEDYNFIASKDCLGVNAGHLFLKNLPWSEAFLQEVWNAETGVEHVFWEQWAIQQLVKRPVFAARTKLVSNKLFNAYPLPGYGWPEKESCWEPGDFMVHFAGSWDAWGAPKNELMKEWGALYNRP